jgi:hypothetical protein
MHFSMNPPRLRDSLVSAGINGIINGAIAWSAFKASDTVPLSMDSIGSPGVTALGNAATVAFSLTLIITCITFFVFRRAAGKAGGQAATIGAMPFLPTGIAIALANTLLAFGAFVAAAVLWQKAAGTVQVGPLGATLVVALVAAGATAFAEWRTKRELIARATMQR